MDEEDLYDEFGNLIGNPSDVDSDNDSDSSSNTDRFQPQDQDQTDSDDDDPKEEHRIILQEDKQLYSTMSQTFGPDVETIVQTHDMQSINVPLVQPVSDKKFNEIQVEKAPKTLYDKQYMIQLMSVQSKMRNVSIVGGLNSGKTSFLDCLILQTHLLKSQNSKGHKRLRYTDTTKLEIERGLTLKSTSMSLLLPNLKGNSLVLNLIDTPGHVDFLDEVAVAQRLTDVSLVVIDVVEGLTFTTRRAIDNALKTNISLAFMINKLDRLVLELRLPIEDSYHKIQNVLDEINLYVQTNQYYHATYAHQTKYSPVLNNVFFGSADLGFSFSLKSFSKLYLDRLQCDIDPEAFAKRLWGDVYYDSECNKFSKRGDVRSFIHFILEPIYKIITTTLSQDPERLKSLIWDEFQVRLSSELLQADVQIALRAVFRLIFQDCSGFVDIMESLSPPSENTKADLFTDGGDSEALQLATAKPDNDGPLIANVAKVNSSNQAMLRVLSGTLKKGQKIRVLGEHYNEDDEDQTTMTVNEMQVQCGRYKITVEEAYAGMIVLLSDVNSISKSGSIVDLSIEENKLSVLKPIDYLSKAVFKVVIEPSVPSELPKLLDGLRKTNRAYPGLEIKVEESGEHVILGSGELYLDSFLHDLRMITDIDIKISDPITRFAETCVDASFTKISTRSHNGENEITIIAEPLEGKLAEDVESGKLAVDKLSLRKLSKLLRDEYQWDSLASRSVISFGPNATGSNVLLNDTIAEETDTDALQSLLPVIIQGFQWAVKEGPLTDEPIRTVKFKIIDASFAKDPMLRNSGQIIPMVRKACYVALLTSTPRLLEPYYSSEIITTVATMNVIDKILERRRGVIIRDTPIPATKLYKLTTLIPVIDSVGFETDVRTSTQGDALVQSSFHGWRVVPGDPLDKEIIIPKLKPATAGAMARDFVMKTRKRKGMSGEPGLERYVDAELRESLKDLGLI